MALKRLFFFRHGQTAWNHQGIIQGHEDIPLNEVGIAQAHTLGANLADKDIEMIVSSDLSRALQTATIVAEYIKCPIITHTGLREVHAGDLQGKPKKELLMHDLWPFWVSHEALYDSIRWPGGESKSEVKMRASGVLKELIERKSHTTLAISSHSVVMRLILKMLTRDDLAEMDLKNGGFLQVDFDDAQDRWIVKRDHETEYPKRS